MQLFGNELSEFTGRQRKLPDKSKRLSSYSPTDAQHLYEFGVAGTSLEAKAYEVDLALRAAPELDAAALAAWVAARHADIERGELIYIAHQLDVVGRAPGVPPPLDQRGASAGNR